MVSNLNKFYCRSKVYSERANVDYLVVYGAEVAVLLASMNIPRYIPI